MWDRVGMWTVAAAVLVLIVYAYGGLHRGRLDRLGTPGPRGWSSMLRSPTASAMIATAGSPSGLAVIARAISSLDHPPEGGALQHAQPSDNGCHPESQPHFHLRGGGPSTPTRWDPGTVREDPS